MKIHKETIPLPIQPHTMGWRGDELVCYENGEQYYPSYDAYPQWREMPKNMGYGFGGQFDRSVSSADEKYTLIYTSLGTKGLLLKTPHKLIREVNRSYYCAEVYEYAAVFYQTANRTFLIHCPHEYCRLEVEDVETGDIITLYKDRKPGDMFHSRLEISPGGRYLISKGWLWHPLDVVAWYDLDECLRNPLLLDRVDNIKLKRHSEDKDVDKEYGYEYEFSTASFVTDQLLIAVATNENTKIMFWDMDKKKVTNKIEVSQQLGHLLAIDEDWAWDLFQYPKLINLQTGQIAWQDGDIVSGAQNSSIIVNTDLPAIAWNRTSQKLAIAGHQKVDVLTVIGE
jgi:hypothetical protein